MLPTRLGSLQVSGMPHMSCHRRRSGSRGCLRGVWTFMPHTVSVASPEGSAVLFSGHAGRFHRRLRRRPVPSRRGASAPYLGAAVFSGSPRRSGYVRVSPRRRCMSSAVPA